MSWLAAYTVAGLWTVLLCGGAVAYACGAVTRENARTGYLGADWHRREFQRAYAWFTLAACCWLSIVGVWLAVR